MKLRQAVMVFLAGLTLCVSLDAQGRQFTDVEKLSAYRAVIRQLKTEVLGDQNPSHISLQMTDLASIHPASIEETSFTPGWNHSILVRINVESNNSVGVPVKNQYRFRVWGSPGDPLVDFNYRVKCLSVVELASGVPGAKVERQAGSDK